MVKRFH